ncbi:hypothetical protein BCEP4_1140065 [Burkholderia cepacia]|nr:hypothetical protein BCEP4_1140065 [Burkholderia cepacia]
MRAEGGGFASGDCHPGATFRNKGPCDIRVALCYIQGLFPCDVSDNLHRIYGERPFLMLVFKLFA